MEYNAKVLHRTKTQETQQNQATDCPFNRNEFGRGRLWKGTDEDRLFFHNIFLDKWERHMERMGYPFSRDTIPKLKYRVRLKGSSNRMCVPKESAIAILMEAWEARGRYPTADKDLKQYYVEYVPPTQDDTPRSILVHPQPPTTQDSGSMPRQDHTNDTIPTGSDVNQSAPTPNTEAFQGRSVWNRDIWR
jgi:hypothetical protein